jgi:DNA repair photolyase
METIQTDTTMNTEIATDEPSKSMISGIWKSPAIIALNDFKDKSLSDFSFNTAVGCAHGCRFCYVVSTAANKQAKPLANYGVNDPDAEWGQYVFVRDWDEEAFLKSLRAAEQVSRDKLKPDGHRAVMFCSTTDPYQRIKNADRKLAEELNDRHQEMVTRALELVLEESTLNVRILTRSPLAKKHFDLYKRFGKRLLFGMSVPTLDNTLARIYEPNAPAPTKRLETLQAASDAGVHVYAAMAPTYPECDEADLRRTMEGLAKVNPITIFHEPINIRADNVERIRVHAESLGVTLKLDTYDTRAKWRAYAYGQMASVERIAAEMGLTDKLNLWPDQSFRASEALQELEDPTERLWWLDHWWTKVSRWAE